MWEKRSKEDLYIGMEYNNTQLLNLWFVVEVINHIFMRYNYFLNSDNNFSLFFTRTMFLLSTINHIFMK